MRFFITSVLIQNASDNITPKFNIKCYMQCESVTELNQVLEVFNRYEIVSECTGKLLLHTVYLCDLLVIRTILSTSTIAVQRYIHPAVINYFQSMSIFGLPRQFKHNHCDLLKTLNAVQSVAFKTICRRKRCILRDTRILNPERVVLSVVKCVQHDNVYLRGLVVCSSTFYTRYRRLVATLNVNVDVMLEDDLDANLNMDVYTVCIWDANVSLLLKLWRLRWYLVSYFIVVTSNVLPGQNSIRSLLNIMVPSLSEFPDSHRFELDEIQALLHSVVIGRSLRTIRWFTTEAVVPVTYEVAIAYSLYSTVKRFLAHTGLKGDQFTIVSGRGISSEQNKLLQTLTPACKYASLVIYINFIRKSLATADVLLFRLSLSVGQIAHD